MSVPMLGSDEATEETEEIFETIRERHGHPDVASYYHGIAQWPEFLTVAWERISPLVNTPLYEERKHVLVQAARSSAFEIPLSSRSEVIERGTYEELHAIPTVFRFRLNPDMLRDVSLIRALLDGPEAARYSCFSFAVR